MSFKTNLFGCQNRKNCVVNNLFTNQKTENPTYLAFFTYFCRNVIMKIIQERI